MNLLVTGASGFIAKELCKHFASKDHQVTALSRRTSFANSERLMVKNVVLQPDDLDDKNLLQRHAGGMHVVVHCAARVHQLNETASNPIEAYREVNTRRTLLLATAAAQARVKRFVFLSSVKVNGGFTLPGKPFTSAQAAPQDPYGVSKWEAEIGLREIAAETGMEVVIIRPPLVYGPGVKANFLTMMQWLHRGMPLPLGAIANQRSLVALPNLVDFISLCVTHPKAANQTFMISDQHDVSTTELLRGLGNALKRPARLIPVPQALLEGSLQLLGKGGVAQRLCGDLTVDSTPATELLGWKPPISVQQGLQLTVDRFLATQSKSSE
jgi:nucleoside-diphosphate-sugar epimerase